MPLTRSGTSTRPIMNEATVKNIVASVVKAAISNLPDKGEMKDFLTEFEVKIHQTVINDIKKVADSLIARIEELELKHTVYEAHFESLEKRLDDAEQYLDDAEQYSRRACLRIYGIPLAKSTETATDCVNKVKDVFKEIGVAVPDDAINRAHRVGVKAKDRNTCEFKQAMIVKFLAWNHRNAVFCGCKKSNGNHISLDLSQKSEAS